MKKDINALGCFSALSKSQSPCFQLLAVPGLLANAVKDLQRSGVYEERSIYSSLITKGVLRP